MNRATPHDIVTTHVRRMNDKARTRRTRHILKTAADFAAWADAQQSELDYTSFCEGFGYQPQLDDDTANVYRAVLAQIGLARRS